MKIVLIGPDILFKGGIAQYNHFLADAIVQNGHTLKFIGFSKQYPEFLYPSKSGDTSKDNISGPTYHVERIFHYANPFSTLKALKIINEFQPDIIIIPHWIWFFTHLFVPLLLMTRKFKRIVIAHNSFGHDDNFLSKNLNIISSKLTFKLCDHIVVQSNEEKENVQLFVKTAVSVFSHPDYSQYLPLISKEDARKELNLPVDFPVFLFLGFVRKYKGAELFAKAIAQSEKSIGIIAGEIFDKEIGEKLYSLQIGCNRLIILDKYFTCSEASILISAADAIVLPYLSVTGSGIASIAKACSKPVLASDLPLFKEIFENYPALFFKTGKEEDLLKIIERFRKDEYILKYDNIPDNIVSGNGWNNLLEHILKISEAGNE